MEWLLLFAALWWMSYRGFWFILLGVLALGIFSALFGVTGWLALGGAAIAIGLICLWRSLPEAPTPAPAVPRPRPASSQVIRHWQAPAAGAKATAAAPDSPAAPAREPSKREPHLSTASPAAVHTSPPRCCRRAPRSAPASRARCRATRE